MPSLPRLTDRSVVRVTAFLAGLTLAACGTDVAAPAVEDAWIRSNPNGMGAAYLTITMPSSDTLVDAAVDGSIARRVEVHEVIEDDGMMRMREVDGGIPLPAGSAVSLRPGGYHIMLLEMPDMLEIGTTVDVTLRFSTADPIVVTADVREGVGADGMPSHAPHDTDHGGHMDHGHPGDHEGHMSHDGHGSHHGSHHESHHGSPHGSG